MPTKEERDRKRLERLQAEQKQLQARLKKEKQRLQDLQNEKRRRIKNELARAQSRVQANERKTRTRRLIVTGAALEAAAETDPELTAWLRKFLDLRLERDQDRVLVGLEPRPAETPETAPDPVVAGRSAEVDPLAWETS